MVGPRDTRVKKADTFPALSELTSWWSDPGQVHRGTGGLRLRVSREEHQWEQRVTTQGLILQR